jgi:hypothetical protein
MKVLVTGGTNGMGKGVAKILAASQEQAHEVIILCRSEARGEATVNQLRATNDNPNISMVLCDLTKLSAVRNAIDEIHGKHAFLDGVFINAGLGYAAKREETEDGMDPHFQVNYLSQFMLTLNLLDLLERSANGGRVVFNVTQGGEIFWDDMQMKQKWHYERGIGQAMVAKRMLYVRLHDLYSGLNRPQVAFFGFEIPKTVWTNQINIIPGTIMYPLFTEQREESLRKSGKLITWKKDRFIELEEDKDVLDGELQDRLWNISLDLCKDERTGQIAGQYRPK